MFIQGAIEKNFILLSTGSCGHKSSMVYNQQDHYGESFGDGFKAVWDVSEIISPDKNKDNYFKVKFDMNCDKL